MQTSSMRITKEEELCTANHNTFENCSSDISSLDMHTQAFTERGREKTENLFHSCINVLFLLIPSSECHKVRWLKG